MIHARNREKGPSTMPTMTNADRRRGRMNTRWLLLVALMILGILSQTAVAQMEDEQDIEDPNKPAPVEETPKPAPTPESERQMPAPTEAPAPDAEKPTETPPTMDAPEDTPPTEDAPEDTPPPTDVPPTEDAPEDTPPPTDAPEDTPPPAPEDTPAPTKATEETLAPTKEPTTRRPTVEPVPTEEPSSTESPTDPTDPTSSPTDAPETSSPTEMPTSSPTTSPTDVPETESPTAFPTMSLAPTDVLPIDIKDDVSLIIKPVSEPMSASNSKHFENTAELFLSEYYIQLEQPIYNVTVTVTGGNILSNGRVRRLQEMPMQVDMVVSGSFYPVPGLAETAEDNSIGGLSRQFFNVQGDKFVEMLKETDNQDDAAYFASISSVESVPLADDNATSPPDESSSGGLSTGGIVAVALVGALVVSLVAIFVYKKVPRGVPNDMRAEHRSNRQNGATRQNSAKASRQNGASARQSDAAKRASQANGASARHSTAASKSMAEQSPPIKTIGGPSESYLKRVDSDVQSDLQSGWGAESLLGMESNMSYAYSLEDGIKHTMSADFSDNPVPSTIARMPSMGSERNDENDDLDIDKDFAPTDNSILREITAPPGKLGLVLNTSDRGPVVEQVASGSPLEGMVWPGDVIVSIDDIKTKKMSADQVTQYMTENLFKKRKLTVLSDGRA